MNNEEKILSTLEKMNEKFDGLEKKVDSIDKRLLNVESDIGVLKNDIGDIKGRLTNVESRLDKVEFEAVKTNISIENRILPLVQVIKEGYDGQRDMLKEVKRTVNKMAPTVLALDIMHLDEAKKIRAGKQ